MRNRPAVVTATLAIGAAGALSLNGTHNRSDAQARFLSADHVMLKSARDVDPKAQTAVIKLHKGAFEGQTVWYILTDTSDVGVSRDLDAHYAAKLANLPIGCPACVQSVTLGKPAGKFNNDAVVNFAGIPDFSRTRTFKPGPNGFPPAGASPGAVGDAKYTPFIRIEGSPVVYNAPIIAVGGQGYITGPGGAAYGSVFAVNCPPVAFVDNMPVKDKAENAFNR